MRANGLYTIVKIPIVFSAILNFHVKAFQEGIKYSCDKHHQEVVHEGIRKYPFNKCEQVISNKHTVKSN